MPTPVIDSEIVDHEQRFWRALAERDVAAATDLTDFPCLLTGPQGASSVDRETFTQMMKDAPYTLDRFDLSDVKIRQLSDDVAVVAYKVDEKLTLDGKPLELEAIESSTWIRRDGKWRCAQHSEALAGDPFGRDKASQAV